MTLARNRGRAPANPVEPLEVRFPLQFVKRDIVAQSKCRSIEALTGPREFTKLRFLACCFAPVVEGVALSVWPVEWMQPLRQ